MHKLSFSLNSLILTKIIEKLRNLNLDNPLTSFSLFGDGSWRIQTALGQTQVMGHDLSDLTKWLKT